MTDIDVPASGREAVDSLTAHLTRVDMLLARAGLGRAERNSVCRQIVEQFHDLLPAKLDQASATQVEAALAKLGSDAAFASDEVTSLQQALRIIWHRFWIGTPIPLALNDQGHRRIIWSELIKRLGWVYLIAALSSLLTSVILMGELTAGWLVFIVIFIIGLPLMIAAKLLRIPVASLPRAEHWPMDRLERHRSAGPAIIIGSFILVSALFPAAYAMVAVIAQRSVWPIDRPLFLAVVLILAGLLILVSLGEAWRRRQRRLLFRRWAEGSIE